MKFKFEQEERDEITKWFSNQSWILYKETDLEKHQAIKRRFTDHLESLLTKKFEGKFVVDRKEITIPCCHTSGMHDPTHYEERKLCEHQLAYAFLRLCALYNLDPQTKSDKDCFWCNDYPEKKKKGEGLSLMKSNWKKEFDRFLAELEKEKGK